MRYSYTYDKLGQLTSANYYSDAYYTSDYYDIYEYAYDKAGNITSVGHHYGEGISNSDIKTYTYGNETWGDLLTNYNGTNITYDAIGNPLNWRNATSLTWQGRRLTNMVVNGTAMSFVYNSDGIRQSKTYGNTTVDYITNGSKIIAEHSGNTYTHYIYDENATIMGMLCGGEMYTYRKNLQGDVTGIYNASGELVVEYSYSPYGEVLSTTGTLASTIGIVNSFRYRGYYYDTETGFYYLNSRYYDPAVGRFLNADAIIGANGDIEGYNSFAYCSNNPVNFGDPTGLCIDCDSDNNGSCYNRSDSAQCCYTGTHIASCLRGIDDCITTHSTMDYIESICFETSITILANNYVAYNNYGVTKRIDIAVYIPKKLVKDYYIEKSKNITDFGASDVITVTTWGAGILLSKSVPFIGIPITVIDTAVMVDEILCRVDLKRFEYSMNEGEGVLAVYWYMYSSRGGVHSWNATYVSCGTIEEAKNITYNFFD